MIMFVFINIVCAYCYMIMFVFYVSKCTSPSGPSITSSLLELGQKCGLRDVCKIMKRSTVGYINYSEQQD